MALGASQKAAKGQKGTTAQRSAAYVENKNPKKSQESETGHFYYVKSQDNDFSDFFFGLHACVWRLRREAV